MTEAPRSCRGEGLPKVDTNDGASIACRTVRTAVSVANAPCTVYLVHALELGLVYVGITDDFDHRWRAHQRSSWWLGEVVVEWIDLYVMESREAARQMEAAIIADSNPRYNTAREEQALARYRANRDAVLSGADVDPWPVLSTESVAA